MRSAVSWQLALNSCILSASDLKATRSALSRAPITRDESDCRSSRRKLSATSVMRTCKSVTGTSALNSEYNCWGRCAASPPGGAVSPLLTNNASRAPAQSSQCNAHFNWHTTTNVNNKQLEKPKFHCNCRRETSVLPQCECHWKAFLLLCMETLAKFWGRNLIDRILHEWLTNHINFSRTVWPMTHLPTCSWRHVADVVVNTEVEVSQRIVVVHHCSPDVAKSRFRRPPHRSSVVSTSAQRVHHIHQWRHHRTRDVTPGMLAQTQPYRRLRLGRISQLGGELSHRPDVCVRMRVLVTQHATQTHQTCDDVIRVWRHRAVQPQNFVDARLYQV